jgi:hypothetical protein
MRRGRAPRAGPSGPDQKNADAPTPLDPIEHAVRRTEDLRNG